MNSHDCYMRPQEAAAEINRLENLCRGYGDMLLAAAWQSIETAPKDGTRIFLWWPHWSAEPCLGHFSSRTLQPWISDVEISDQGVGPTHWMPLPKQPTETLTEGKES
jgi:hypothetical protein